MDSIQVRDITEDDLILIMEWRMRTDITKYMLTDPQLTIESQKAWFYSINNDTDSKYWMIEVNNKPSGIIHIDGLNNIDGTVGGGFYFGEKSARSLDNIFAIIMSQYDYIFDVLGKNKFIANVFSLNKGVIALHQICGGKIIERKNDYVEKDGKLFDMTFVEITAEAWHMAREDQNYQHVNFKT